MPNTSPKRPRGRPPGSGQNLHAVLGTVQITPEQLTEIDAYCARVGRSKAEITRYLWQLALAGEIPPPK